jgi:hypothetical protein
MSGSERKGGQETNRSPNDNDRTSLADFLAPPRPRHSAPPEPQIANKSDDIEARREASTERAVKVASVAKPEPESPLQAKIAEVAESAPPPAPLRDAETRTTVPPSSEASARSLIPVATSDSDMPEDPDDEFSLPGTSNPWTNATVRRATFVALLAAAAAVPAWVVFRARGVAPPVAAATSPVMVAAGHPTTLQPNREIEADDENDTPPAASATEAQIDPVLGLQLRREARRLLEGGQIDQGVETARRAILANPADPECYVLLAAGLQDQGRWAESREVFSRCVHKSKDAINSECVYFATSATITNR